MIDTLKFSELLPAVAISGTQYFIAIRDNGNGTYSNILIQVSAVAGSYLPLAGGTMTGPIVLNTYMVMSDQAVPTPPADGLVLQSTEHNGFSFPHVYDTQGNAIDLVRDNITVVRNNSGSAITKGTVLYVTGATGSIPTVGKAKADSTATLPAVFIAYENINNNSFGRALIVGNLENIDLSAFNNGDLLYVSPTTAGALTSTKPTGANYAQSIGTVLNNGVANGVLQVFVRVVEPRYINWLTSDAQTQLNAKLAIANNLSDVNNKYTSRQNLGILHGYVTSTVNTTSNVMSSVTGMTVAVSANKKYKITGHCSFNGPGGGVNYTLTFPAGTTMRIDWTGNSTDNIQRIHTAQTASGTTIGAFDQNTAAQGFAYISGYFQTTNSGNVVMQHASAVNLESTDTLIGTWMEITELE